MHLSTNDGVTWGSKGAMALAGSQKKAIVG